MRGKEGDGEKGDKREGRASILSNLSGCNNGKRPFFEKFADFSVQLS